MHSKKKQHKKINIATIAAFVFLSSTVIFLIITAASASIGTNYLYSEEFIGWPNKFIHVVYEKAAITSFTLNYILLLKNYGMIVGSVTGIRIFFLLLRVKKKHV